MSSINVYKSSPTSPSKGIKKYISLGHGPESQWTRESIRSPKSNFQNLKCFKESSLSQPQNLNPSSDIFKSAISVLVDWVIVMIYREGISTLVQFWPNAAVVCSPTYTALQTKKTLCISHRERTHSLALAGASELEGSSKRNEMSSLKQAVLFEAWLEKWRQELIEPVSKSLGKLFRYCVCVAPPWQQIKQSQILGNLL